MRRACSTATQRSRRAEPDAPRFTADCHRHRRAGFRHRADAADWALLVGGVQRFAGTPPAARHRYRHTLHRRHRHLGRRHAGGLGPRHRRLRLVDRHRQWRHADLGDLLSARLGMAHADHPHRRIDDGFRRRLRRALPDFTSRSALAVLLALSLSRNHAGVASIPQSAAVGFRRDLGLCDRLGAVLVSRIAARSGDIARPRAEPLRAILLRPRVAGLLTPTVVSIHSIVGLDFAAGMTPGWHSTEFPPFFVFGAMLSGFGMVTALVIVIRRFYGLANLITPYHLDILAMMLLASSVAIGYAYAMEVFAELYSADAFHHHTAMARLIGPFAPFFWATVLLNVCVPQLLWSRVLRRAPVPLFIICIAVMIGMWIERYLLVVTSLAQDFMPSAFGSYWPTFWDWATTLGSFGLFFTGIFLFLRFLPIVAMSEMSAMRREWEKRA